MPKGTTPEDILGRLKWVHELPDSAWARGIIDTADSLSAELQDLEQQKVALDEKIKSRLKVLRLIPARADREARLMYDMSDVAKAKRIPPATGDTEE